MPGQVTCSLPPSGKSPVMHSVKDSVSQKKKKKGSPWLCHNFSSINICILCLVGTVHIKGSGGASALVEEFLSLSLTHIHSQTHTKTKHGRP